ncbi:MAG: nitrilase-related carbon-nitrogen hydrolase [Oscillospiraceae bacterium]
MNTLMFSIHSRFLAKQLSPLSVKEIIDELNITPSPLGERISHSNIRISMVNLPVICYKNSRTFIEDMNDYVAKAVAERSQLVCFPQYTGLLPLTIFSMYDQLEETVENALLERDEPTLKRMGDLFCKLLSSTIFDFYYNTFALLAIKHNIYIQAGSVLLKTSRGLVNRAFLFAPNGEAILQQDKLYPNEQEKMLGVVAGTHIKVAETLLGNIAVVIGEDNRYFEPYRLASSQGCKIVIAPSGGENFTTIKYYRSTAPMRSQENRLYSVQSVLLYNLLPMKGQGIGGFYCPYQLTKTGDGILSYLKEPGVLSARLDVDSLVRLVDTYTADSNSVVYRLLAEQYQRVFGIIPPSTPNQAGAQFLLGDDTFDESLSPVNKDIISKEDDCNDDETTI